MSQNLALTTIAYPGKELGKKAVETLMRLIQDRSYHEPYLFQPRLVEQRSVKNITETVNTLT